MTVLALARIGSIIQEEKPTKINAMHHSAVLASTHFFRRVKRNPQINKPIIESPAMTVPELKGKPKELTKNTSA